MRSIIAIAASLAIISSCTRDNTVISGIMAMADVHSSTSLTTDEGLRLNIVNDFTSGGIDRLTRSLITADVLRKLPDGTFDISLTSFTDVLVKPAVDASTVTPADDALFGDDPAIPIRCWLSNGYINAQVSFFIDPVTPTTHVINLICEGVQSDTLRMTLRHNANNTPDTDLSAVASAWASFDIKNFPTDKYPICIACNWENGKQTFTISK